MTIPAMPVASVLNLAVTRGATWNTTAIYKDGATGAVIDLTGIKARMQIRSAIDAAVVILDCTTTNGRIDIVPAEGKVTIDVGSNDTQLLSSAGQGAELFYDLELYDDAVSPEYIVPFLRGKLTVVAKVTR